ncbi:MAG: DUF2490 domain-containing protein [Bacteroidetes bacterium]|nr:DUF2490 domain-containing protein [Bacteroidota bacterium]
MKRTLILATLIMSFYGTKATVYQTISEPALWNAFVFKASSGNWYFHNEARFRLIDNFGNTQQWLVRPSIHFTPNNWLDIGAGYSFITNYPYLDYYTPRPMPEHNTWFQLTPKYENNSTFGLIRIRHEQRFQSFVCDCDEQEIAGWQYNSRLRIMPEAGIEMGKWKFSVYNEMFWVIDNRSVTSTGVFIHQNWLGFWANRKMNERLNISAGYMNFYLFTGQPASHESHHMFRLSFNYHINLTASPE